MKSQPLSEYESIKCMVIDILRGNIDGATYIHLRNNITLYKLLPSHLETMIDEGLLYRAMYQGRPAKKVRLTRKALNK